MKALLITHEKQQVKTRLASTLAKTFFIAFVVQFTLSSIASAQHRQGRDSRRDRGVIGAIQINANANLPSYRYEDYDFERARELLEREERNFESVRRSTESARKSAQQASRREEEINKKVQTTLKQIEMTQQKTKSLSSEISSLEDSIKQKESRSSDLQKEIASLNQQVESVTSVIADLKAKLESSTDEAEKAKLAKQIESQAKILEGLSKNLNSKNAELATLNNQIQNQKQSVNQKTRELEQTRAELNRAQSELPQLVSEQQRLRNETQNLGRELERIEREFEKARRDMTAARDRVEDVRRNIEVAKMVLEGEAQRDATEDGRKEGQEIGELLGYNDGRDLGEREGRERGTADGKARDYAEGRQTGKNKATAEATAKSNQDAKTNGENDGRTLGTQQGLDEAYRLGHERGLAEGHANGTDKAAYKEGRAIGEAEGLQNAIRDAKPQVEIGYKTKEKEYLTAPLKSITVGESSSGQAFKGTQGRYSPEGDDRYYNPTPGVLPHPRLLKFYQEMYDYTYRRELSAQYRISYEAKKSEAHGYFYEQERRAAYAKDYPQSRKDGEAQGFNETYSVVYSENYNRVYPVVKEQNRQIYFDRNKTDKTQNEKGYKVGLYTGSKAKGRSEGEAAVYKANIEIEKKKAYDSGVAQAKNLYDNNPVIQIESITLTEADRDGIFRPSENLIVEIRMKNFGLKAKTDLALAMKNSSGAIVVNQPTVTVGSIAGQSEALVYAPIQAFVQIEAKDGASLATQVVAYTQNKIFAEQKFSALVQYPASVKVSGFDGILVPGVETPVKLIVMNRSKSVQKLDMSHLVDSSKVILDKSSTAGLTLNPQETKEVILKLTGRLESKFEETSFETSTRQAGLAFAMPIQMAVTLIKRHAPTAESKGLIISANLARGGGKKLFESDKFDTWDLRVDGAIQNEQVLANYKAKALHIMADVAAAVDASTLAQLKNFISNNGSVIVWGDRLNESIIGEHMLSVAGVQVTRITQLNEKLTGVNWMRGLTINLRGYASLLQGSSIKTSSAFNSTLGSVATLTYNNALIRDTGYVMLAGVSPNDISAAEVKGIVNSLNIAKLNFDSKLNAMGSNAAGYASYVQLDIENEMHAAVASNFYKESIKSSKLVAAIKKMLEGYGAKSEATKQFLKSFPEFMKISKKYGGQYELAVSRVLTGDRYKSRTVKEVYCDHYKKDETYCKTSGGWPGGD